VTQLKITRNTLDINKTSPVPVKQCQTFKWTYRRKPTRCYWMLYCTYNLLNMFRALICPSSGARDYSCVIAAHGV